MADWIARDHEIVADNTIIAETNLTGLGPQGERERLQNARLMAASPKLREALRTLLFTTRKDFKAGPEGQRQWREF